MTATSLSRTAPALWCYYKPISSNPLGVSDEFIPLFDAHVNRISIKPSEEFSTAVISLLGYRWDAATPVKLGDKVFIVSTEPTSGDESNGSTPTPVFSGFFVKRGRNFSGGSEQGGAYEENTLTLYDHRYLLHTTNRIYGQVTLGYSDDTGTTSPNYIAGSYTHLYGRRAIFNPEGKGNRHDTEVTISIDGETSCDMPVFCTPKRSNSYWTARHMIRYLLSPVYNPVRALFPLGDPANLTGLDNDIFDRTINNVTVEGLSTIQAVALICRQIGAGFREQYDSAGNATLIFYRHNSASSPTRSGSEPILHTLHAPAVGENLTDTVAANHKLLWSASIDEDTTSVVNSPIILGAPLRVEFTSELSPGWLDSHLVPDTSDSNANLFFSDADLQQMDSIGDYSFFDKYHAAGDNFQRTTARRWRLNETEMYGDAYDRPGFKWTEIVDSEYITDSSGKAYGAPFGRTFLPCLTDSAMDSIKVEFSLDGGTTWQAIPAAITNITDGDEAGILIEQPNLSEMIDQSNGTISGGTLDGVELNYWTSLCDDKLNSRSFKDNEWKTRVRITASVQLDTRLFALPGAIDYNGTPFPQVEIYDLSPRFKLDIIDDSSDYSSGSTTIDRDDRTAIQNYGDVVRLANQDLAIAGRFVLERMYLGDGSGEAVFQPGDSIDRITGRDYLLTSSQSETPVYPEIIQIDYDCLKNLTTLLTRDLRYAAVRNV